MVAVHNSEQHRRAGYPALLVYEGGIEGLEFHPIANAFPLMEGDAFRELVEDVRKNGQQQPILTFEGKILDGRNRYRACLEAGEEPWTEPWVGDNPVEAVVSLNLHRRHLTPSQRAALAVDLVPLLEAETRKRRAHGQTAPGKTLTQFIAETADEKEERTKREAVTRAAKMVGGTNRRYVQEAARLKDEEPETFRKVERGEVGLSPFVNPKKAEPTVGDLMQRAGVSMKDAPRRSEEEKAFYPAWEAALVIRKPVTQRLAAAVPPGKELAEFREDMRAARDALNALLKDLDELGNRPLRAVE